MMKRMKTIVSRTQYFEELISGVAALGAGERAMVATMSFTPGEPTVARIAKALAAAAGRGVEVTLIVDAYNFLMQDGTWPGPLFYDAKLPEKLTAWYQEI
jgi:hypothetical protein